jgi:cobalt-zinc-cadmium efflux system protein
LPGPAEIGALNPYAVQDHGQATRDVDLEAVVSALSELPNVQDVHHVRAWTLTSSRNVFSAHLGLATTEGEAELLRNVHDLLREKFGFAFSTVQLETGCLDESAADEFNVEIL